MTELSERVTVYSGVADFVENYLTMVYRRQVTDVGDTVWCPEWWRHAEAIARLEALWRSWEYLRGYRETGHSVWFLDHADRHMEVLFSPRGPFQYCSVRHGHKDMLAPLPVTPPPHDLFTDPEGSHFPE
ncbi:DUF4913 domain-containing protein [Nocardia callitridis]|uniref:DUF4913 domain-containing protein n=1 Tax=Nocardia callitridis TaxID=648753 RepID=A0ABP9KA65_9NOCA